MAGQNITVCFVFQDRVHVLQGIDDLPPGNLTQTQKGNDEHSRDKQCRFVGKAIAIFTERVYRRKQQPWPGILCRRFSAHPVSLIIFRLSSCNFVLVTMQCCRFGPM
mmetsp:Transcript_21994/g.33596  ORF Transcript_21994/g.33596 Transcript_21994/m.33596 type:complete len:107 (+) Transcript_21994:786-1106(+)